MPPAAYGFGLTAELEFGGLGFLINPAVIGHGTNTGVVMLHVFNYADAFETTLGAMSDMLGLTFVNTSSLLTSAGLTATEVNPPLMSLSRVRSCCSRWA
jgi:hypothetical protein